MTLTVLLDRDDVRHVSRCRPDALRGAVIAWDLPAHFELLDRQVAHHTPWDFVSSDDLPAARRFEQRVQKFWQQHAHIEYRGLDLLALARFRHVAALARMAWTAYLVRRALEIRQPKTVCVLDDAPGHGLDQPPGCPRMPLLQRVVRGVAEQAGIAISMIPACGHPFRDAAAEQAARPSGPPVDLAQLLIHKEFMIFAGSGADLLRQLPAIQQLQRNSDLTPLQLYRAADPATLAQLRANGHHLYHELQVTHPSRARLSLTQSYRVKDKEAGQTDSASRGSAEAAHNAFKHACTAINPELATIFANPHLVPHFDFIFGAYAERMAAHVDLWQDFFDRHTPRLVVAAYPAPILDVAVHRSIPALLLPHGIMTAGDPRWYACLPNVIVGAASSVHQQRLLHSAISNERIRITGDPGIPHPSGAVSCKPPSARPRILLVTSAIAAPAHQSDLPQINWKSAMDTFHKLADLACRRSDWEFTIQPHPRYDQVELYQRLHAHLPPEKRWKIAENAAVRASVAECDIVVVVNNRSSAIVETSLCNRPVYLLCGDMINIDLHAWGLSGWPSLRNVDDLEREIERLLTSERHLAQRKRETADALHVFLGESPCDSDRRCLDVMLDLAGQSVAAGVK